MTSKNIVLGVAMVLAVAVAGFFFFSYIPPQEVINQQQEQASQGKINIDAVCQGALAYMTFPDAASADVFVAECKEGKHPEVIEQYKAGLNLDDGAAI
jgi:hypothetical protein